MVIREQLVSIRLRAERAAELLTEEATKNALIMPMIRALGYDVFDPTIVIPEFTADFGVKKGEKVDYAIKVGGNIEILIECKPANADLSISHASQLYRYFSVTKARFGILTNGKEWRFYTDLDSPNKMDEKPFFIFFILEYGDQEISELDKFSSTKFSVDGIVAAASDLKMKSLIAEALRKEFSQPSDDFVRLIARRFYSGNLTAEVRARFTNLILMCISDILRDQANQRLKDAIDRPSITAPAPSPLPPPTQASAASETTTPESKAQTTADEIEAFHIIKAIARKHIDVKRIFMRDAASYCAILLDDNNRRPIARLFLEGKKRRAVFFVNKEQVSVDIESVQDIYTHGDHVLAALNSYSAAANGT